MQSVEVDTPLGGRGGWQTELAGDCLMQSNALGAATVIMVAAGVERRTRL